MESSVKFCVKSRGIAETKGVESVESPKSRRFLESRGVESGLESLESWNHAWN